MVDWGGGALVCSLLLPRVQLFVSACNGRLISAAAPLALVNHLPLPMIAKRGWTGFPVRSLALAFFSCRTACSSVHTVSLGAAKGVLGVIRQLTGVGKLRSKKKNVKIVKT